MAQALVYQADGSWDTVRQNNDIVAAKLRQPLPQASVYNSAGIALTSGTDTAMTFDRELYSNGSMHSTTTNPSRFTAKITGLYSFGGAARITANGTGRRQLSFRVNGSQVHAQSWAGTGTSDNFLSTVYETRLTAGDYVEFYVFQDSGVGLNVVFDANLSPKFWIHRVGGFTNEGIA